MTYLAFHQLASVPLAAGAGEVSRRLAGDPVRLARLATGDALTAMGPQTRRWGLPTSELPTTTADTVGRDELGCVEVAWSGPEDATGWPALHGRLVVAAGGPAGARLTLLSPRSPHTGLVTGRLDLLHRQRLVQVGMQRFLDALRHHLDDPADRASAPDDPRFDRAPVFLHHLEELRGEPGLLHDRLLADLQGRAERATAATVDAARATLTAGGFRDPAEPTVQARIAQAGEPASAWVGWRGDEEATGWPQLDLGLLIDTQPEEPRLTLLSTREPGYDLSRLRIDKQQRDHLLRTAGSSFAAAMSEELCDPAPRTTSPPSRVLGAVG